MYVKVYVNRESDDSFDIMGTECSREEAIELLGELTKALLK